MKEYGVVGLVPGLAHHILFVDGKNKCFRRKKKS